MNFILLFSTATLACRVTEVDWLGAIAKSYPNGQPSAMTEYFVTT